MSGRMLKTIVTVLTLFSLATTALAVSKEGNSRKGKYLYRKNCRSCHMEGATGARPAKALSPMSKTQAEWEQAFEKYKTLACQDEWAKLKSNDLNDIYAYLWGHAYDSPSPAKCE